MAAAVVAAGSERDSEATGQRRGRAPRSAQSGGLLRLSAGWRLGAHGAAGRRGPVFIERRPRAPGPGPAPRRRAPMRQRPGVGRLVRPGRGLGRTILPPGGGGRGQRREPRLWPGVSQSRRVKVDGGVRMGGDRASRPLPTMDAGGEGDLGSRDGLPLCGDVAHPFRPLPAEVRRRVRARAPRRPRRGMAAVLCGGRSSPGSLLPPRAVPGPRAPAPGGPSALARWPCWLGAEAAVRGPLSPYAVPCRGREIPRGSGPSVSHCSRNCSGENGCKGN